MSCRCCECRWQGWHTNENTGDGVKHYVCCSKTRVLHDEWEERECGNYERREG